MQSQRVELSWIKAHEGYLGNERADQLARKTAAKYRINNIPISWAKFKQLQESMYKKWALRRVDRTSYNKI